MSQEISAVVSPSGAGRKTARAAVELILLTTVAWIGRLLVETDPAAGVNVPYFGAKWIAYTYLSTAISAVLVPGLAVLGVMAAYCLLRWRRPADYWRFYRLGSVVIAVWIAALTFGLWYGQ